MIFFGQFIRIIAVVEFLFQTEIQDTHGIFAIEAGNLLAKAAIEDAVLQGYDNIVILFKLFEQGCILTGDEARIDDRGFDAMLQQACGRLFGKTIEAAEAEQGYLAAFLRDLIGVEGIVALLYRTVAGTNHWCRDADGNRVIRLIDGPVQHSFIFLWGGWGQINEIRDIGQQRDVIDAKMRYIIHSVERGHEYEERGWIVVDADILGNLVEGPLQERAVGAEYRMSTVPGKARGHSHGLLLGDTDINEL